MITKNQLKKLSKKELLKALELACEAPCAGDPKDFINEAKNLQPPVKYEEPKNDDTTFTSVPGSTTSEGTIGSTTSSDSSSSSDNVLQSSDSSENPV